MDGRSNWLFLGKDCLLHICRTFHQMRVCIFRAWLLCCKEAGWLQRSEDTAEKNEISQLQKCDMQHIFELLVVDLIGRRKDDHNI